MSAGDLAHAVLNRLFQSGLGKKYRSNIWTIPSLSEQSHNLDILEVIISEILCACQVILIFDGLDMLSSPFRTPFAGNSAHADPVALEIYATIRSIAIPHTRPEATTRGWLILTARRPDLEWLGNKIGLKKPEIQRFELQGLDLSDSVEFSQKILCDAGEDTSKWGFEDIDWLEAVIDILQGLPSALLEILPVQRALSIPWREFYHRLHSDIFNSLSELKGLGPYSLLEELCYLSSALPRDCFVLLLIFSCYWNETPPLYVLQTLFMATSGNDFDPNKQEEVELQSFTEWAALTLSYAIDRGYIRTDQRSEIAWVHPLFTIYARAFVLEFSPYTKQPHMHKLILESIQLIPFHWKMERTLPSSKDGLDIETTNCGGDANVLTCIKLFLQIPSKISANEWPIHLVSTYLADHPLSIHITESLLELLCIFIEHSQGSIDIITFCIKSIGYIFCSSKLQLWCYERRAKLLNLSNRMMQLLDKYHGEDSSPVAPILKAFLLGDIMFNFSDHQRSFNKRKLAQDAFPIVSALRYKALQQLNRGTEKLENEKYDNRHYMKSVKFPVDLPEDKNSLIPRLDIDVKLVNRFFDDIIENLNSQASEYSTEKHEETPERNLDVYYENRSKLKEFFRKYTEGPARRVELENSIRCCPFEVKFEVPSKNEGFSSILKELEDATDTGDVSQAFKHHQNMLEEAMDDFSYDKADEHIESLRDICKGSVTLEIFGPLLDQMKKGIDEDRLYMMLVSSLFPSEGGGGRRDAIQVSKELLTLMADVAPKHASLINTSWFNQIAFKRGNGIYLSHMPRGKMQRLIRMHAKCSKDEHSVTQSIANNEALVEALVASRDAFTENKYTSVLANLDRVEEIFEKDELIREVFAELDFLEKVRCYCKFELKIDAIRSALFNEEFNLARSYVNDILSLIPDGIPDEGNLEALKELRTVIVEQASLYVGIEEAKSCNDFQKVKTLCGEYVKNWKSMKKFGPVKEVDVFLTATLEWMIQKAIATEQWEDGLNLCDENLRSGTSLISEIYLHQDKLVAIRELCEGALINERLDAAEAKSDVSACLESLNHLERLWNHQRQTSGQIRFSFITLSEKLLRFLKSSYEERCIPCARWARHRDDQPCILDRQNQDKEGERSLQHDRKIFRVVFGCAHHCQGGYCFLD
ncbi:hypothetical protein BGW36DRAFT_93836 [Talaromyces proteolyticus]|uniref:Uncharacterized protein n=1 Tax=Talaromyces proteolyticus TaxID=1131652 RepID=A0AAD4L1Q1_9EURO|nr:uncharacterized protein BGW36DRAFT_93836 [Talaromyces proteolyticus]KAH8703920.1 hypothetical protein BGW36DRAFT_93836 [Talaromyces proteolyticus]